MAPSLTAIVPKDNVVRLRQFDPDQMEPTVIHVRAPVNPLDTRPCCGPVSNDLVQLAFGLGRDGTSSGTAHRTHGTSSGAAHGSYGTASGEADGRVRSGATNGA